MQQFLPDIPYEKLPSNVIRYLCEKGVRSMHEYGLMDDAEDAGAVSALKDLDIRAACFYKALNGYRTKDFWRPYRSDPNAVLTLIDVVKEGEKNKIALGRYSRFSLDLEVRSDIDRALLVSSPQVWDALMDLKENDTNTFNGVFSPSDIVGWYSEDPVRSCKTVATNGRLMSEVMYHAVGGYGAASEVSKKIVETSVGFLHMYKNDKLQFLYDSYHKCFQSSPDFFDSVVAQLYTIMDKSESSIAKLKDALAAPDFGGKPTRSRSGGWFREYLTYLGNNKPDMLLDLVKNVPPVISIIPVELRRKKEFRSLKRLFQLSGDVG